MPKTFQVPPDWEACIRGKSDADHFSALLFRLIAKADPKNRKRLGAAFPWHVKVWEDWQANPENEIPKTVTLPRDPYVVLHTVTVQPDVYGEVERGLPLYIVNHMAEQMVKGDDVNVVELRPDGQAGRSQVFEILAQSWRGSDNRARLILKRREE